MTQPVAWLHVLDNTEGIPGNDPMQEVTFSPDHPFGIPGRDYSEEFLVTTTALVPQAEMERLRAIIDKAPKWLVAEINRELRI